MKKNQTKMANLIKIYNNAAANLEQAVICMDAEAAEAIFEALIEQGIDTMEIKAIEQDDRTYSAIHYDVTNQAIKGGQLDCCRITETLYGQDDTYTRKTSLMNLSSVTIAILLDQLQAPKAVLKMKRNDVIGLILAKTHNIQAVKHTSPSPLMNGKRRVWGLNKDVTNKICIAMYDGAHISLESASTKLLRKIAQHL